LENRGNENRFIDVCDTPFSRYGAYVAVSADREKKEIILHNVRRVGGEGFEYRLVPEKDGERPEFTVTALPHMAVIDTPDGYAEIYVRDYTTLVFESHGLDLFFEHLSEGGVWNQTAYGAPEGPGRFKVISVPHRLYSLFTVVKGEGVLSGPLTAYFSNPSMDLRSNLRVTRDKSDGGVLAVLTMSETEAREIRLPVDPASEKEAIRREWEAFLAIMPKATGEEREFATLTWYNLWSSFVRADGNYGHDAMIMSKKIMSSVWSWDHCFNALAMIPAGMGTAYDQFELPFLHQAPTGALPDNLNPNGEVPWGITKPPIHGWTFGRLMDRFCFPEGILRKTAVYLEKQTDWWMNYRDCDGDGVPDYPQGCDSGWDNATVFDMAHFMETPDLSAYLILQMRAIARIYGELNEKEAQSRWTERSDGLLGRLIEHSWDGERFVARKSHTHEYEKEPTSMLPLQAIVLGELLDADKMAKLVAILKKDFLTEHGLATESPSSPYYDRNGYWRGPIWAPSTYLVVDGLNRAGYGELAKDIAKRFLRMASRTAKGNYENFDALTGKGLCAPGYTWTASVYMLLLWEYGE